METTPDVAETTPGRIDGAFDTMMLYVPPTCPCEKLPTCDMATRRSGGKNEYPPARVVEAEQTGTEQQVRRGRNGQKLGEPLDHSQQRCVKKRHLAGYEAFAPFCLRLRAGCSAVEATAACGFLLKRMAIAEAMNTVE